MMCLICIIIFLSSKYIERGVRRIWDTYFLMMNTKQKKIHDKTSLWKVLNEKISNIKSQCCVQYFSFPKYDWFLPILIFFGSNFWLIYFLSKRKFYSYYFFWLIFFSSSTNKHFFEWEIELRHKELFDFKLFLYLSSSSSFLKFIGTIFSQL